MAITYSLTPIPIWVLMDLNGTVAGGGYIKTFSSLDKVSPKTVYMDAGINGNPEAWPNPIIFDLDGTQGPFYWAFDTSNPSDLYYLEAFNAQGNLLWTIDNYNPSTGSGGGGSIITNYIQTSNYIANNTFIDHVAATANPVGSTSLVIAPSNHKGFTPYLVNPVSPIGGFGVLGPDIMFNKNTLGNPTIAQDQITFPKFTLGTPSLNGSITPVDYIRYQCNNAPDGETYKNFQFPICQNVNNLSSQQMSFLLWAAVTATPVTLKIYIRQYYGSGTGSTGDTRTLIGTCVLSTTWSPFNIPFTVPNVSGNSIGNVNAQTNDDAIYIQIEMPLGSACDVLFTKPALYLGQVNPVLQFEDYDQINTINLTPRTGDIRVSLQSSAPLGWLPMNDSTIGNTISGATYAGSYTFQLYKTLWDSILDTWAPVSTGRGASAIADFLANKTLTMPLLLGRVLAGAGSGSGLTARALGQYTGSESVTLGQSNLPTGVPFNTAGSGSRAVSTSSSNTNVPANNTNSFSAGLGGATSIMQPTSFFNIFIKL